MITELGHFALILALIVAAVQTVVPALGAHWRDQRLMAIGGPASIAQLGLLALAFAALTHAYVTSDFSVENVWINSHSTKPLVYRISGVWGNHEGSMLLWVLILALFGAMVALFGSNLPDTLRANVLAVQASIALAFLAFILWTSNPFNRLLPAPQQSSEEVVDNIAQADVHGQSWATTRLRVTLLPDRRQWRLGLEANADVASDTESRKGPAAFFHDAWANVRARKILTVDHRGVRVGRSEAAANIERNLKGFETDYDGVPVLNMIARSIAKQQYEDKYQSSQVEAENKLAWRANSKFESKNRLPTSAA